MQKPQNFSTIIFTKGSNGLPGFQGEVGDRGSPGPQGNFFTFFYESDQS